MSTPRRPDKCPVCGKPAATESKPFCSQGCKDRDLLKWLDEGYRVPGAPADENLSDRLDSDAQPSL